MERTILAHPSEARTIEGWCVVYQWFGQWQALHCRDRAHAEHELAQITNTGVPATVLLDGQSA